MGEEENPWCEIACEAEIYSLVFTPLNLEVEHDFHAFPRVPTFSHVFTALSPL